jgi:general secretion pathway protein A
MYNKFFGFKEKPFKLVPNPEYLFLSKSHEEALAHLTYAITHGDGFVEITGEVGTGKTTLCRVFLENLDKSIEAAYIFNPKLDALQLLKAINDEFDIDSSPDNTKDLIDRLNTFLIEKKGAGHKVLVLIDEAQNLSLEVLEQLRLLSNLETTQEKLLQIILVGQPELGEMLSSHQLRQLGQRITINCQLSPLTYEETRDYIRHRITLASHRAGPSFDKASYRTIYEYSRGIPRLINIACDRALLNAFSHNSFNITSSIAKEAVRELTNKKISTSPRKQQVPAFIVLAAIVVPLVAVIFYFNSGGNSTTPSPGKNYSLPDTPKINLGAETVAKALNPATGSAKPPKTQESEIELSPKEKQQTIGRNLDKLLPVTAYTPSEADALQKSPIIKPEGNSSLTEVSVSSQTEEISFADSHVIDDQAELDAAAEQFLSFLKSINSRHSRNSAMQQTLGLWSQSASIGQQVMMVNSDQAFFHKAAWRNGLLVQPMATDTDLKLIQGLNLPAILTFYLPNHAWPKYLTLAGVDADKAYLDAGDQGGILTVDRRILKRFWSGEVYIVWKNFIGLEGIITENSDADSVENLKMLLKDLAYLDDAIIDEFDIDTKKLIKAIQTKNGLDADGKVGPLTKIVLYNENSDFIKPSLVKFEAARTENGS